MIGKSNLAGVAQRSVAFVLDVLLVSLLILAGDGVLTLVLGPAIRFSSPGQPISASFQDALLLVGAATAVVLSASYFAVSWSRFHGTPGQYLLGLRVYDRSTRDRLTASRALLRWIALGAPLWILSPLAPGVLGLAATVGSFVWMAALFVVTVRDEGGQGPHDRWTQSVVIRSQRDVAPIERDSTPQ